MIGRVSTHLVTAGLAVSYVVFGVFFTAQAEALWWPFGLAVAALSGVNVWSERRRR